MKKLLTLCAVAGIAFALSGCRWCTDPIANAEDCIEVTHKFQNANKPDAAIMVTPNVAISNQVFRPVFRTGPGRLTVVGVGDTEENATYNAISKFIEKASCDYIVAVSKIINRKKHPTWRLWSSNSYSVTLSGIPMYLDKLAEEKMKAEDIEFHDDNNGVFLPSREYNKFPEKNVRPQPTVLVKEKKEDIVIIPARDYAKTKAAK